MQVSPCTHPLPHSLIPLLLPARAPGRAGRRQHGRAGTSPGEGCGETQPEGLGLTLKRWGKGKNNDNNKKKATQQKSRTPALPLGGGARLGMHPPRLNARINPRVVPAGAGTGPYLPPCCLWSQPGVGLPQTAAAEQKDAPKCSHREPGLPAGSTTHGLSTPRLTPRPLLPSPRSHQFWWAQRLGQDPPRHRSHGQAASPRAPGAALLPAAGLGPARGREPSAGVPHQLQPQLTALSTSLPLGAAWPSATFLHPDSAGPGGAVLIRRR